MKCHDMSVSDCVKRDVSLWSAVRVAARISVHDTSPKTEMFAVQSSSLRRDLCCLTLEDGPIGCTETSLTTNLRHVTFRKCKEHRGGSLKSPQNFLRTIAYLRKQHSG